MKKTLINLCLFILMFVVTICAGYYRTSISKEKGMFMIRLPATNNQPEVLLNLANQSLPKKLVQPARIVFSSGHGGGIKNCSSESLFIKVQTEGFVVKPKLTSIEPSFNKDNGEFLNPLEPNKAFNLDISLNLPRESFKKELICNAKIKFINLKDGSILGTIPIKIVNSKNYVSN